MLKIMTQIVILWSYEKFDFQRVILGLYSIHLEKLTVYWDIKDIDVKVVTYHAALSKKKYYYMFNGF